MVEISLSGSGEGPGWVTAPGYSTAAFSAPPVSSVLTTTLRIRHIRPGPGPFPEDVRVSAYDERLSSKPQPRTGGTHEGTVRFPSIETWIYAGAKGWTQDDMIDDDKYGILQREAHRELSRFVGQDGTVSFSAPGHIVMARKRAGAH